jgi:aminopeptidase N
MKFMLKTLYIPLILLLLTSSLLAQNDQVRKDMRESEKSRFSFERMAFTAAPTPNQRLFDVNYYLLDLDLHPDQFLLEGAVTISGISITDSLEFIEIDFYHTLTVDSIKQNGVNIPVSHQDNLITIPMAIIPTYGESFRVTIYYHGDPEEGLYRSFGWSNHGSFSVPIIWTLSEPYGSPVWWPCKDDPNDKADSVYIKVTVPSDLIVASNGILTGVQRTREGFTYHWKTRYPISTYLVSLAISNYEQFSDWYAYSETDSMEMTYYVYPEHLDRAKEDFSITVEMMEFYASVFGEYPFIKEKYGMAVFPWGGGMEHQTITSYGAGLIWGNHYYDFINAHELAHQWFGDCITMRHWSHIWLNEGFASYAEALWYEYIGGTDVYHTYVNQWDQPPLNSPLFVTDSLNDNALFSRTVYDKGGWVLHMLRGVLGDSLFFESLRAYASDPDLAYKTAVTEDFQKVCEEVSGIKLDQFFQQWVYGNGRPDYKARWSVSGINQWEITLEITQMNSSLFKMPLQVFLSGPSFEKSYTIWDSLATQRFQFISDEKPDKLEIDRDNWVLKNLSISFVEGDLRDPPAVFSVSQNYPNPFNPVTYIDVQLPMDGRVTFEIYNILGEKVHEESLNLSAGYRTLVWRGETDLGATASSGMYMYRVKYDSQVITRKMILVR